MNTKKYLKNILKYYVMKHKFLKQIREKHFLPKIFIISCLKLSYRNMLVELINKSFLIHYIYIYI